MKWSQCLQKASQIADVTYKYVSWPVFSYDNIDVRFINFMILCISFVSMSM